MSQCNKCLGPTVECDMFTHKYQRCYKCEPSTTAKKQNDGWLEYNPACLDPVSIAHKPNMHGGISELLMVPPGSPIPCAVNSNGKDESHFRQLPNRWCTCHKFLHDPIKHIWEYDDGPTMMQSITAVRGRFSHFAPQLMTLPKGFSIDVAKLPAGTTVRFKVIAPDDEL